MLIDARLQGLNAKSVLLLGRMQDTAAWPYETFLRPIFYIKDRYGHLLSTCVLAVGRCISAASGNRCWCRCSDSAAPTRFITEARHERLTAFTPTDLHDNSLACGRRPTKAVRSKVLFAEQALLQNARLSWLAAANAAAGNTKSNLL